MKKLHNHYKLGIISLITVLAFGCELNQNPSGPPPGPVTMGNREHDSIVYGRYIVGDAYLLKNSHEKLDLWYFFQKAEMSCGNEEVTLSFNNEETWRNLTAPGKEMLMMSDKDQNTMTMTIYRPDYGKYSKEVIVRIEKMNPGFSFLPEEMNTGIFEFTFW